MKQCNECGSTLLVKCHICLSLHKVDDNGMFVSHQRGECMGAFMKYGTCKGSNQKANIIKLVTIKQANENILETMDKILETIWGKQ